jgi:transmembrane sensor
VTRDAQPADRTADDAVAAEAALWVARLDLGTIDRQAFAAWRDADIAHAIAFNRALSVSEAFERGGADRAGAPVADPLQAATSRRTVLRGAGGAVAIGLLAAGGLAGRAYAWTSASTAIGQNRKLSLPDGSLAALNTDSCLAWRFSRHERTLWVERGEVAIDLCRGPQAMMHGEGRSVALSDGRFNARLRGDTLDLLVLRGLARSGVRTVGGYHSLLLSADAPTVRPVSHAQLEAAIAWQQGEILFDDATLGTAVEEYNRFLTRKIVIVDPDLATIPVGGRFTSNDPAAFLQAMTESLGVHVSVSGTAYLLTR